MPSDLAEKILRERASAEGERRTVTVLFIDARGSTETMEKLDPEDARQAVQQCTELMVDAVHRYEGTVTQFRGDGILALFGAPIAHEDSARRAVSAALAMRDALRRHAEDRRSAGTAKFAYRIGLNTGPVIVGRIGDDLSMDYTAIGDTVNLAARMEEWAPPWSIYVTQDTYRLTSSHFEFRDLDQLEVRGRSASVRAYEAVRELPTRSRLEIAGEQGLTAFVGRDQELAVLSGYLQQAKRGQGQVVFVSGDAGIGKSRLLLEFRRGVSIEDCLWLQGQCISYGRSIPYLPLIDIIKRTFDIGEGDDDTTIIRKVDEGTCLWDESARATVAYLKFLLSVDPGDSVVASMDPMERRAGMLDGLRTLLLEESKRRPLAVVVEDLHWIDERSEEALETLVDAVASARVLLILTYRPAYAHSLGERTYYSRVALSTLPPDESSLMAERVLNVAAMPRELEELVVNKAEGNPFYIEEVLKNLVETGVLRRSNGAYSLERRAIDLRIPDTIQDVILSRIDRLEREAKEAIQLASVIGREFTVRLLGRISDLEAGLDDRLSELKALELIRETAYFPELSYMFKHALTHGVAYSTLLVERRQRLHRVVGAAIEELYSDRLTEQYEALAYHYYEGQEWEKALDYLVKAGDKAAAAFANQEALAYYDRALEVCQELGDSRSETFASIAEARGFLNNTIGELSAAYEDFDRMLAAARKLGDRRLEGLAQAGRVMVAFWDHNPEVAEEAFRAAMDVADEGLDDVRLFAGVWFAEVLWAYGRLDEARPLIQTVNDVADRIGDTSQGAIWMGCQPDHHSGRFDAALRHLLRWRAAAEQGSLGNLQASQWFEALACAGRGQYQEAITILQDVISTSERVGEVFIGTRALNSLGWVYNEVQALELAMEWNLRGVEEAVKADFPDPECENNARLNLGDTLFGLGRLGDAEEQFRKVERVVRDPRPQDQFALWIYAGHFFHSYGALWLARGDPDRALQYANEGLQQAESVGRRKNVVKARRLLGQALMAHGKLDEAEQELVAALQIAQEVGNPPQLWKTFAALGDLRSAQRRDEEGRQAYREAVAVIDGVAGALTDKSLRDIFLNSAHVRDIKSAAGIG